MHPVVQQIIHMDAKSRCIADHAHGCEVMHPVVQQIIHMYHNMHAMFFSFYCINTTKRRTADDYDDDFDPTGQYCKNNGVCYFYISTISYCTYQCFGCFFAKITNNLTFCSVFALV